MEAWSEGGWGTGRRMELRNWSEPVEMEGSGGWEVRDSERLRGLRGLGVDWLMGVVLYLDCLCLKYLGTCRH